LLTIFVISLVAGLALGLVLGGRPRRLAELHLRGLSLALVGVLIQAGMGGVPHSIRPAILVCSLVLVAAWLLLNREQRRGVALGLGAIGVGFTLNAIVIVANGVMPVEPSARDAAGLSGRINVSQGHYAKHLLAGRGTRLALLDDRISIRALHAVVSVGDLVLLAGIVGVIAFAMCGNAASPNTARQPTLGPSRIGAS
jgi:hypothetical protein